VDATLAGDGLGNIAFDCVHDFLRAPVTKACCTNVITMKAEHHSYKKLHRNLLTAAQSGLTKFALKGTPFRQLPRKHWASARPMN
jgi:hypothetical protein